MPLMYYCMISSVSDTYNNILETYNIAIRTCVKLDVLIQDKGYEMLETTV